MWHYEILVGYDLDQRQMILRSGVHRRITREFALFEKTWQRAGHWALAVVATDSIPATASAEAYLEAVIGMEQVGRISGANAAYATALRRWSGPTETWGSGFRSLTLHAFRIRSQRRG